MLRLIRKFFRSRPRPWNPYFAQALECAKDLIQQQDYDGAIFILNDCIAKSPDHARTYFLLAYALQQTGKTKEACEAYRAYLVRDPADPLGAGISLSLLEGGSTPSILPQAYVTKLFDDFAPTFDKVLADIKYQAPSLLADEIRTAHPARINRLLDLGCGTGLSGLPYRDHADIIEGVDISPGMLEKARARNIYTHLHQTDLHDFLKSCENTYDVIVAADVLVYVGALEDTMKDIAGALKQGGLLGFTVQGMDDGNFKLGEDRRYWHMLTYLEKCIRDAGLNTMLAKPVTLRMQNGQPVPGFVVLARRGV